jgi:hypothetical protein
MTAAPRSHAWLSAGLLLLAACTGPGNAPSGRRAPDAASAPVTAGRTTDPGSRYLPTAEPLGAVPAETDPLDGSARTTAAPVVGFPQPAPAPAR